MDAVDRKILGYVTRQGRIAWNDLAKKIGLSPPAIADRIRRLEDGGVIRGYAALLDPDAVGCHLTAFVAVTLEKPRYRDAFLKKVARNANVQECHHVAGDDDYLLKVRCRDPRDLESLVSDELKTLPGVARTRTTIVMRTEKESPDLPLAAADEPGRK